MVTETVDKEAPAEEANLAPEQPEQTEDAPEGDVAVAPAEEAVASNPELDALRAEIAELRANQVDPVAIRQQTAEELRNENRIRQAAAARQRELDEQAKARALREARLHLHEAGLTDITPETISPAFESYVSERKGSIRQSALQDAADGWTIASAQYFGQSIPSDLSPSPEALEYANGYAEFARSFGNLERQRVEADLKAKGWKSPEEVNAVAEAARKDERQKLRPQEDLASIEGAQPSQGGEMTQARWDSLTPAERKDQKNIAAYDEWCRKNP